jgi:hypothetical protein
MTILTLCLQRKSSRFCKEYRASVGAAPQAKARFAPPERLRMAMIVHHWLGESEVPKDWGFMAPDYSSYPYKLKMHKEAPKLSPEPVDRLFLASLMRRATNTRDQIVLGGRTYKLAKAS